MNYRKAHNLIHFLVLTFPIVLFLFGVFRSGNVDIANIHTQLITLIVEVPFVADFVDLIYDSFGLTANIPLFDIGIAYLSYIFLIELISLMFDFILFIPRWLRGCFKKYEKD